MLATSEHAKGKLDTNKQLETNKQLDNEKLPANTIENQCANSIQK